MTRILAYLCKLVGSWQFGQASQPCDQELASSHTLSSFVHASYRKLDTGSPGCYTTQIITTPFVLQAITERYFWLLSRLVYHKMPQVVSTILQQFPNAQGLLIGKREPQFNFWQRDRAHRNNQCGCGWDHSGEYFLSIGFEIATSTFKASHACVQNQTTKSVLDDYWRMRKVLLK